MASSALTRWMHRTHRSVGGVLSLLIATWFASGAVMTFADYPRFTEAERLVLAPDCGMKYLSRASAFGKLVALVEGARIVRRELGAARDNSAPAQPLRPSGKALT